MPSYSRSRELILGSFFLLLAVCPANAAGEKASAEIKDGTGKNLGKIEILGTQAGALLKVKLSGLSPGAHAIHFHDTGTCEGDFESAGGIYNPVGAGHGFLAEDGPMAGDLPNLFVPASGEVEADLLNSWVTLNKTAEENIFDEDGTALVIFEKPDDYGLELDADFGARVACGVVKGE